MNYIVKSGDTLSSIAKQFSLTSWQAVYNTPENAAFRKKRPNPNWISPGDVIVIPGGAPGSMLPEVVPFTGARYLLATTLSWIDPRSGLPEVDKAGEPPTTISKDQVKGKKLYRFAHLLEIKLQFQNGRVVDGEFTADSGLTVGTSFLGTAPAQVGNIGRKKLAEENALVFRQVVGCRTEAPEKIGGTVGEVFGGLLGRRIGREIAESVKAFPPIWTELEARVPKDGGEPLIHLTIYSLFPSVSFYSAGVVASNGASTVLKRPNSSYDGVPNLQKWEKSAGWGMLALRTKSGPQIGNPWGMTSPAGWGSGSINAVPVGY
jgi:hypothetical protein